MGHYQSKRSAEHSGWFLIPGYKGYVANRKGFIKNLKTGHETQGGVAGRYRKVSVYRDGKESPELRYTHELICRAFQGPPKPGQVVLHDDNDRLNITAGNLKWGTQSKNIKDMWGDGLRTSNEAYQEENSSSFTHDGVKYYLNPILEKAQRIKVTQLKLKDLAWNIENARFEEDRVRKADYSYPLVVLSTVKWGYVVIDGTHRLIKAHRNGKKNIDAYVLKETDITPFVVSLEDNLSFITDHLPPSHAW